MEERVERLMNSISLYTTIFHREPGMHEIVRYNDMTDFDIQGAIGSTVTIIRRSRWFQAVRPRKRALIITYPQGSYIKEVKGRQVNLHQTDAVQKTAEREDTEKIEIDGELVALFSNGILHVLTEDRELLNEILEESAPLLIKWNLSEKVRSAQELLQIINDQGLKGVNRRIHRMRNYIEVNQSNLDKCADRLKWLTETDFEKYTQEVIDAVDSALANDFLSHVRIQPVFGDDDVYHDFYAEGGVEGYMTDYFPEIVEDCLFSMEERVVDLERESEGLKSRLESSELLLKSLQGGVQNAEGFIDKLQGIAGYDSVQIHENGISMITQPIDIDYLEYRYRLGSYIVNATLSHDRDGSMILIMSVKANEDNHYVNDYLHPHVNHKGQMCSGNLQVALQQASEACDFISAFTIAWLLLSIYNEESPYAQMIYWPQVKK